MVRRFVTFSMFLVSLTSFGLTPSFAQDAKKDEQQKEEVKKDSAPKGRRKTR